MVQYCSVPGCSSRSRRDFVAFFRFPTARKRFSNDLQQMVKLRRQRWVDCIPRFKNVPENKFKHARVCANHFISGRPAALQDVNDPDWTPSLNLTLLPRRVRLKRLAAEAKAASQTRNIFHNGQHGDDWLSPDLRRFISDLQPNKLLSIDTRIVRNEFAGNDLLEPEVKIEVDDDVGVQAATLHDEDVLLEPEITIEVLSDDGTSSNISIHERSLAIAPIEEIIEISSKITDKIKKTPSSTIKSYKYGCPWCKATFKIQEELSRHIDRHKVLQFRICGICSINFETKSDLQNHWVEQHSLNFIDRRCFPCDICERSFEDVASLQEHRSLHTKSQQHYDCSSCDRRFLEAEELLRHRSTHLEEEFRCGACGTFFFAQKRLDEHVRKTHTDGDEGNVTGQGINSECMTKQHVLDFCRNLNSWRDADKGKDAGHYLEDKYVCPHCDADFQDVGGLARHILCHAGTRAFKCEHCSKAFYFEGNLKQHMAIHTGVGAHACDSCNKSFKQRVQLKRHIATHARRAGRAASPVAE